MAVDGGDRARRGPALRRHEAAGVIPRRRCGRASSVDGPAGSLTGDATISARSDTTDELDETVIIDITSVTNATESTPPQQQQTITITDDDGPTVTLTAGAAVYLIAGVLCLAWLEGLKLLRRRRAPR